MRLFRNSMIQTIALVGLLLILLSSLPAGLTLIFSVQDLGYSSGFQGPKAKFYGIRYNNQKFLPMALPIADGGDATYGGTIGTGASMATFDTTLRFDPDAWDRGKPNLIGEMTTVFIPEESLSNIVLWQGAKAIPQDWFKTASLIKNPQESYSWNISDKTYRMEQWVLRFYMSLSAEWDGNWDEMGNVNQFQPGDRARNYYTNTEVWLEFDLTPTWYIQGGGTAYFAIGKIQVAEFKKTAQDIRGNELPLETDLSVVPQSPGANLYIFYGPWGVGSAETTASIYQGKELNPKLFTNKVYAHFDLNNFGVTSWNELFTIKIKGDVVTVGFDITVFVIGEWDVKDVQNIPGDFGRTSQTLMPPSLLDYLSDPRMRLLLALLTAAGLFLFILIFAPWVFILLMSIFGGGRRRR